MTPEQTWADLTLHGWRPVRNRTCDGIWNDDLKLGYGLWLREIPKRSPAEMHEIARQVRRLGTGIPLTDITWQALGMSNLTKILARLEQT